MHEDSCNCDGYTNSIYTLSISSATQAGLKPWYLEECSSTLASTFSSGTLGRDKSVATVDMDPKLRQEHLCTMDHTGTSASAPLAAGMCALALEANPNLTWRDMQHILVLSANPKPLLKEPGWTVNGARRKVSHKFGFGLMDGGAMVNLAEQWTTVPTQHICKTPIMTVDRIIDRLKMNELFLYRNESGCEGSDSEVRYLEHVQCKIKLRVKPRGSLKIVLTSPSGTPSILLKSRPKDNVFDALDDWPFMSVHFWGEDPRGTWKLAVFNDGRRDQEFDGIFNRWQLILYGTDTKPVNLRPPSLQLFRKFDERVTETSFFKDKADSDSVYEENNNLEETGEVVYNCHSQCDGKGCYGPEDTQCISCANYKLNRSCVQKCPDEDYFASDGLCIKCHRDCRTCTGPGYHSCLTCARNLYYITDLALCIQSCPHTYFQEEETRRCVSCHETCASCEDGPNLCSSCESHLYLYNNSCHASCPPKTYLNHHLRCVSCHPSCEWCHGSKQSDCIVKHKDVRCVGGACTHCPGGLLMQNTSCVSVCSPGWYQVDRVCKRCWPGCTTCYGSRKDECVTCAPGRTLARGQCRLHCPRNMYSTVSGCANCHQFCSTCNGGGAYSCTTCASDRYLDEPSGLCYSCHNNCLTCSGPTNISCTACKRNMILDGGQCLKSVTSEGTGCVNCIHTEGEKLHSSPAGKRRIWEPPSWEESVEEEPMQAFHRGKPPEYSPFVTVTVIAVIACIAIVVLLALLFATLQVR
ncbi:furin-like protease 2 [Cimex lectularius]|uniref:P/Homo B domain-containing protein n=1 Tax=Cimex lectularius TaxID=79782 RepID=A0A8I6SHP2_CIMLE|nr:furin-like protease 2 [Cimex lectularius]